MEPTFAIEDPRAPAVRALVALLDRELYSRYPEASNLQPPDLATFTPPGGLFVVARLAGAPVACGALIFVNARLAEVRRMFVHPDHRGRGLSRRVLADLEERARGLGCLSVRLETGQAACGFSAPVSTGGGWSSPALRTRHGPLASRARTGQRQPEALALYRSAGYVETAKYAPYEDDPLSVCFSKPL